MNILTQILGWLATAIFVGSYFFARPAALRAMQMLGALLWIAYGVLIDAMPVIAANILVFGAAAWTFFARNPSTGSTSGAAPAAARSE
jgi:hypothetical protein